ncbi:helix-turn-helix domain-containing protein [Bifidobacterium simiarum]|uniref:helix-turn-helix domain-containing protein n=1 Tax=Bifidobacterium simiarum TaxID=2045441 RepID=UPI000E3BF400
MVPWAGRKSAYTRDFERQVAWLSVHAPHSVVSHLMRMDWKSVGPVCERGADTLRAERGVGLFDGLRSISVDETATGRPQIYDGCGRPRPQVRNMDALRSRGRGLPPVLRDFRPVPAHGSSASPTPTRPCGGYKQQDQDHR